MKKTLSVIVILGATMTAYGFYGTRAIEIMPNVRTVAVTEGDIVDTIGATGALEAVTTVQVGSQVSGIIQELYVDFNSIVREGDVIIPLLGHRSGRVQPTGGGSIVILPPNL